MNINIIYAHPNSNSFNHAIKETVLNTSMELGHTVTVRDLYKEAFSPILSAKDLMDISNGVFSKDIALEQDYIKRADMLIFIYPIWWASFPSILKGYIDRVLSFGFAYNDKGGLLSNKKVVFIQTMGAPESVYENNGLKDAIKLIQKESIADFTGMDFIGSLFFGEVPTSSREQLSSKLSEIREFISKI